MFQKKVDVNNQIISNNETAIAGLSKELNECGYSCHKVSTTIAEDAQEFGHKLSNIVKAVVTGESAVEALKAADMPTTTLKCANEGTPFCMSFLGGRITARV